MTDRDDRDEDPNEADESGKPLTPLERGATIASALIVLFLLSVLVWDAAHPNAPPSFRVHPGKVEMRDNAYRAEVDVENTGDDAAKGVIVHLELVGRDTTLAETDLTIDWLPGRSSHRVVGFFPRPERGEDVIGVKPEVHGYSAP
jgi:uncharacterized protein (TIGR02588 family)